MKNVNVICLGILIAACEPAAVTTNITQNNAPAAPIAKTADPTPTTDPVVVQPVKGCANLVPNRTAGLGHLGNASYWECTNNCTLVPFYGISFFLEASTYTAIDNTQAMTWTAVSGLPNFYDEHEYNVASDQAHSPFLGGLLRLNTNYPASFNCDEITIAGAIFTFKEVRESGY